MSNLACRDNKSYNSLLREFAPVCGFLQAWRPSAPELAFPLKT
jgi:hypothetical protein